MVRIQLWSCGEDTTNGAGDNAKKIGARRGIPQFSASRKTGEYPVWPRFSRLLIVACCDFLFRNGFLDRLHCGVCPEFDHLPCVLQRLVDLAAWREVDSVDGCL